RKLSHRMIADRLFNEVDVVLAQRLQVPHRLRERPTSVRIDTESRLGTEVLPHAGDHLDVLRVTESDLEVEDREACFQAIVHLGTKALLRVTRKVVEVRWLSFLESGEESQERLSTCSATDVPQRHVDSRPGEVARAGAKLPEAVRERIAPHRVTIPGVTPDDERRHRPERGVDGSRVGPATRFAPSDQT